MPVGAPVHDIDPAMACVAEDHELLPGEVKVHDRVAHGQYGAGTLLDVNEYHTVIDFDDHGIHKFVTSIVLLERTDIPAPVRHVRAASKRAARSRA